MKRLIEKIGTETALAGLFGAIAIVAVFFEMAIANFDSASIAGGVKDIAGTIIAVVMLIVALNALRPKKKAGDGFEQRFNDEMNRVIAKYSPLLQADTNAKWRCNIADNMSVLYQDIECGYHKLFDFDCTKGELSFVVSKTLFMGRTKDDFTEMQKSIIQSIATRITREHSEILNEKYKPIQDGFKLTFSQPLLTQDDAVSVVSIIDKTILLYIVEYKK